MSDNGIKSGAAKKAGELYAVFRKQQDEYYISQFDREAAKYLHGGERNDGTL